MLHSTIPKSLEESSVLFALNNSEDLNRLSNVIRFRKLQLKNCSSEDRAIQLIKSKKPDLIILDRHFSNLDTFSLCRQLKEKDETQNIQILFYLSNGSEDTTIKNVFESGGQGYISKPFHEDEIRSKTQTLIELKKMRETVGQLTLTDSLTNLPNRQGGEAVIAYEYKRSKRTNLPYSIIIGEIDNISSIRKSHGDEDSEAVIKKVADIISRSIREQDTLSRWGGDQLLLLLPQTDRRGVVTLAEKLRSGLEHHQIQLQNESITSTMSFGVASCTGKNSYDQCIKRAAKALEHGRKQGGNCTLLEN
jgi:diguanylate cyclase (GGDEF)-like protein